MDALKFIEERNRMCNYYGGGIALSECAECPALQRKCLSVRSVTAEYITAVEQWSKEHPRKTRQDVFLEQWPNAKIYDNVMTICPKVIDISFSCRMDCLDCYTCRKEFWMKDVE